MSNYKWITDPHGITSLADEYGEGFYFPAFYCAPARLDARWEKEKEELLRVGIKCKVSHYRPNLLYITFYPTILKRINVTAPLYRDTRHGLIKLADTYTSKTVDPEQYEWVKQEVNRCDKMFFSSQTA